LKQLIWTLSVAQDSPWIVVDSAKPFDSSKSLIPKDSVQDAAKNVVTDGGACLLQNSSSGSMHRNIITININFSSAKPTRHQLLLLLVPTPCQT